MPTIEFRTPTSFLFFVAAAVATYYSIDEPAMKPFAQSAFAFFTALGPIKWMEEIALSAFPESTPESTKQRLKVVSLSGQSILFVLGVAVGVSGITSATL